MITKEQMAERLNGRKYFSEMTVEECIFAKENGLVVVLGKYKDLMVFRGAIHSEKCVWCGGTIYLNEKGLLERPYITYVKRESDKFKRITAIWRMEGNPYWKYDTDIPHATFDIYESDELYCIGIVFSMASLKDDDDK